MPPELLDLVRSGGAAIAPLFAILWWLERSERQAAQLELRTAIREFVTAMVEAKTALSQMVTILSPRP